MNLLLLGGTRFPGRHLVAAATARGHRVTTFTRGRNAPVPGDVESLTAMREAEIAGTMHMPLPRCSTV